MVKKQCKADTQKGTQCKNKSVCLGYCPVHFFARYKKHTIISVALPVLIFLVHETVSFFYQRQLESAVGENELNFEECGEASLITGELFANQLSLADTIKLAVPNPAGTFYMATHLRSLNKHECFWGSYQSDEHPCNFQIKSHQLYTLWEL